MNWKQETIDRLEKMEPMRQAMRSIPMELRRLDAEAENLRRSECSQTKVLTHSKWEDRMLDNYVRRQELQWSYENTKRWLEVTQRALARLSKEQQMILKRLYVQPTAGAMEQLTEELGVERSTVYRWRDKALETFTLCMYGDGLPLRGCCQ